MKKTNLWLAGLVAMTMATSCSNDEVTSMNPDNAIDFEAAFVNKSTRAAEDLTADGVKETGFNVFAFKDSPATHIFKGDEVTYTDGWRYNRLQFWKKGSDYWFGAVAPAADAAWSMQTVATVGADYMGSGVLTFDNGAAAGEQDLLYAWAGKVACTEPADMKKVSFVFNHMLSRVKFSFVNGMLSESITLTVSDVQIKDAYSSASVDLNTTAPVWSVKSQDKNLNMPFEGVDGAIGMSKEGETAHKYLIPSDKDKTYTLYFKVNMHQDGGIIGSYEHTVTIKNVALVMGRSYDFKATLSAGNIDPEGTLYPIEFEVSEVEGWADYTDKNVDM